MFITDRFIFLHQPKTGGTFVDQVLTRIHEARGDVVETIYATGDPQPAWDKLWIGRRWRLKGKVIRYYVPERYQHAFVQDIPPQFRDRALVTAVRNIYDRYVSQYEFQWWRQQPDLFGAVDDVKREYPNYPDLTFPEYVRLMNERRVPYRAARHPDDTPGIQTQQFVEAFFKCPEQTYPQLNETYIASGVWRKAMPPIHFLWTHRLNEGLYAFLISMGYRADEIAFIKTHTRILPPGSLRSAKQSWERYYTPDLEAFVRHKERLLLAMMPEFETEL